MKICTQRNTALLARLSCSGYVCPNLFTCCEMEISRNLINEPKSSLLTYKAVLWPSGIPSYQPSCLLQSSNIKIVRCVCANLTVRQCLSPIHRLSSGTASIRDAPSISTFKRHLKSFYFHSFS